MILFRETIIFDIFGLCATWNIRPKLIWKLNLANLFPQHSLQLSNRFAQSMVELSVIWNVMTLMWRHCDGLVLGAIPSLTTSRGRFTNTWDCKMWLISKSFALYDIMICTKLGKWIVLDVRIYNSGRLDRIQMDKAINRFAYPLYPDSEWIAGETIHDGG